MTLPEVVRCYTTLSQLVIMQRADTRFEKDRYFAGPLSDDDINFLIEGLN